jgi:hypothetical protein
MSYDIQLYRKEVKEKEALSNSEDFFENENNFVTFTSDQKVYLKNRLLRYGYFVESEKDGDTRFGFKDGNGISVLLTDNCLYFSSTGEGIFEIGMTASEFTDSGEFAKYDPQDNGWEGI